ncbi:cytochrome o ubiquinol oxidase subunit IV [Buchnera aphidicola (Ceratoglyphina bambusae)]|uniref:cytochrome o ubiquinol oxidase subunit IV n=1 Tax=Buchnera aphidicola TaxID=9 RepID=UPI0031B8610E
MKNCIKKTFINYLLGLFFSIIFLCASIFCIKINLLNKFASYFFISFFAIAQIIIHFSVFLHVKYNEDKSYFNLIVLIFSIVVIFIIIFGSKYIMLNLHNRIMICENNV